MNEQIKQIVARLGGTTQYYTDSQPILRAYVTDRTYPLEERFQVWVTHCAKEKRNGVPRRNEFGPIGEFVYKHPEEFDLDEGYDWSYFLDSYNDYNLPIFDMSKEEFMEMLMETNFGSFVFDCK